MSDDAEGMEPAPESAQPPVERERIRDVMGAGKRDSRTGRYIPVGGGSRTRIPIHDDPEVPRYPGMVGMDSNQREGIDTMAGLYSHLGGDPVIKPGKSSAFSSNLVERKARIVEGEDELAI